MTSIKISEFSLTCGVSKLWQSINNYIKYNKKIITIYFSEILHGNKVPQTALKLCNRGDQPWYRQPPSYQIVKVSITVFMFILFPLTAHKQFHIDVESIVTMPVNLLVWCDSLSDMIKMVEMTTKINNP